MDKIISDTLSLLGLTVKEIKFYQACFELGPATIQEVIRKSKLERSTAYLIHQDLLRKKIIEEDHREYKKKIIPVEPKVLLRMIAARQRVIRRQEIELVEHLPELEAIFKTSDVRPHVRVFEGNTAMNSVWNDVLATKNEVLLWTNQNTENLFFPKNHHLKFIKERIEKKIYIRVLAVNNKQGQSLLDEDSVSLRQSKLLPQETLFSSETYIYDSKVAMLDYNKDTVGVIIESSSFNQAQRSIFEMSWRSL